MWKALRSDLAEFVQSVAEDGNNALSAIDERIGKERNETEGDGVMLEDQIDSSEAEEDMTPADEVARLRSLEETYTDALISLELEDELIKVRNGLAESSDLEQENFELTEENDFEEIKNFLLNFDITSHTDEITEILETYESTKLHFESLVPTNVSYEKFWTRYFFRCDIDRVQRIWEKEDEEVESSRGVRSDVIREGISTMKSLFGDVGNAVVAVSKSVKTNKDEYEKVNISGGFLKARPPFVLNTAVDDQDDDEEEFGWDSDEDEEEDDSSIGDEEDDDEDEEVVFSSSDNMNLEELEEERDILKKTVKVQAEEIEELRQKIHSNACVDKPEIQSFEKDAEIAALKASILDKDIHQDNPIVKAYTDKINEQMIEIDSLKKELLEAKNKSCDTKDLRQPAVVEIVPDATSENIALLKSENKNLKEEKELYMEQNKSLQDEVDALKAQVTQLTSSNQQLLESSQMTQDTTESNEKTSTKGEEETHNPEETKTTSIQKGKKMEEDIDSDDWGDAWGADDDE